MITIKTFEFLEELQKNNTREWFNEHKSWYQESLKNVEETASYILTSIQKFDSRLAGVDVKKCIFRIYRDVRFSKDKSPYKTHFGVFFAPGGKNSFAPGYYLHIEPNESFIGGGVWMPPTPELFAIRQEIYYNYDEFKKITNDANFKAKYPALEGSFKNVKAPKDFDANFEGIEIIKHKCFFYAHQLSKADLTSTTFDKNVVELLHTVFPVNQFLQRATEK